MSVMITALIGALAVPVLAVETSQDFDAVAAVTPLGDIGSPEQKWFWKKGWGQCGGDGGGVSIGGGDGGSIVGGFTSYFTSYFTETIPGPPTTEFFTIPGFTTTIFASPPDAQVTTLTSFTTIPIVTTVTASA